MCTTTDLELSKEFSDMFKARQMTAAMTEGKTYLKKNFYTLRGPVNGLHWNFKQFPIQKVSTLCSSLVLPWTSICIPRISGYVDTSLILLNCFSTKNKLSSTQFLTSIAYEIQLHCTATHCNTIVYTILQHHA